MTPHDHTTYVPGCFRCELSRDEVEAAERDPGDPSFPDGIDYDRSAPRLTRAPREAFADVLDDDLD